MEKILKINNKRETEDFGRELASRAKPGTVIALMGDLGTGKTTLTQAIAENLGVQEPVTSPTFTILQEYKSGRLPLYHFDVYRIAGSEDMWELGYGEYFYGDGICVVEWADRIGELLPEDAIRVYLEYGPSPGERKYTCRY